MFRHAKYVDNLDYPFNAGYVVFSNYFFPQTETGESSEVPLKPFPKAFKENFEYFVTHDLNEFEQDIMYKTFKDKKSYEEVAKELNISNKALTAARTRAFVKLANLNRSKYILSDDIYVPKNDNMTNITVGDLNIESCIKSPSDISGGGDYRLVNVKKGKTSLFTLRMSVKVSSEITDDDMSDFIKELANLVSKLVK